MEVDEDLGEEEAFKIVLIGESGVGKTSIISQFIHKIFQDDIQPSMGGTFTSKTLLFEDGKVLRLDIWDTAGQEKYRALTQMFYKDANAAVLVYDITRKDSFEELTKYWFDKIKENSSSDIILFLAANKSDLIEREEVNEEVARKYAKEINADYCSISAKNSIGIDDLFIQIAKKYTGRTDFKFVESQEELEMLRERKDSNNSGIKNKSKSNSMKLTKEKTFRENKKKKCC
jgi:small GTP-binding protein